jgi:hypothetical protein
MAREAISPAQKLINRYVFNGAVFSGLAALALGRYAWVSLQSTSQDSLSMYLRDQGSNVVHTFGYLNAMHQVPLLCKRHRSKAEKALRALVTQDVLAVTASKLEPAFLSSRV